jgi:uncharacterized membrane-anchored protein
MLKTIVSFLKALLFWAVFLLALYYGEIISLKIGNNSVSVHVAVIVLTFGCLFYFCGAVKRILCRIFPCKSKYEKGLESLQLAFSSVLLNDKSKIEKALRKSEKYLGNIPIISWLRGQQSLIEGDEHRAKAIFYGLSEREKDTVLGAYSLYQLALKGRSDDDALAAINSALKAFPDAQDLILQAIAIDVKSKRFSEAKRRLSSLKKSEKSRLVEAIVYSEEGTDQKDEDLLKKALKLAPELSDAAINCAELLIKNEEYRAARDMLKKSFRVFPNQKVFDKYISTGEDLSNLDKIKLANKLIDVAPDSWIGYYGLAKLYIREEMTGSAFQNLLTAYEKEPFDFIGNELIKVAENLNDPKPSEAIDILSRPLKTKHVNFVWKCSHCGSEEPGWVSVCKYCNRIAEYKFVQTEILTPSSALALN